MEKTIKAAKREKINNIALTGGVAANPRLRAHLIKRGAEENLQIFMPDPHFCTDNAAMIALAGDYLFQAGKQTLALDTDVYSRSLFW